MVTIGGESPSTNRVSRECDMKFCEKNLNYLNINIQSNEEQMILRHLELTVIDPLM